MANKIDVSKLTLLPVPEGMRMHYKHHYYRKVRDSILEGKHTEPVVYPPVLYATEAWLTEENGEEVVREFSMVNPKDTPIKKLGRAIAHNRCITAYMQQLSGLDG